MSLKKHIRWLPLVVIVTSVLGLSACDGGGGGDDAGGATGGETTGSSTGGGAGGLTGGLGSATGPVYVSLDGGGDAGTVDIYNGALTARVSSFNTGLNEGITVGNGRLTAVGVVGGLGTLRRFSNFAARGNDSFELGTDTSVSFNQFRAPKGVELAGLTGNLLIVADAPAAVDGENLAMVPSLHLLTTLLGITEQPALLTTVPVTVAGGRTWDIAYDGTRDRLFAAMTNGVIAVYDNFATRGSLAGLGGPALSPNRMITPGVVTGGVSEKTSINLHGISYNRSTDQLVVSDVGLADSDSDGALFVIDDASTAANAATGGGLEIVVPSRTIRGLATALGNPVDILLRSDGRLYVAEKLNGGGQILIFNGILDGASGNIAPDSGVSTDSLGSSGDPESITEPG